MVCGSQGRGVDRDVRQDLFGRVLLGLEGKQEMVRPLD